MKPNLRTIAVGSTSALAMLAVANPVVAEGMYMGIGIGMAGGENPNPGSGESDQYFLSGPVMSAFIGVDRELANGMFVGGEVAYSGGHEGDANEESSYPYAYDVNYNIDAKFRVGTMLGEAKVYGFAGMSTGLTRALYYGGSYNYVGANIGAGASYEVVDGVSVGLEHIIRFTEGTGDSDPFSGQSNATTLRVSFEF
jgi:hypothetical protein